MEMQTIITLLTIVVILLSLVIVALLAVMIAVLIKVRKLAKNINRVTNKEDTATEWLAPAKIFSQASRMFKHRK